MKRSEKNPPAPSVPGLDAFEKKAPAKAAEKAPAKK